MSDPSGIRDPLQFRRTTHLRLLASSPLLPWSLRRWAAGRCMEAGSAKKLDHRLVAIDHSRACSRGEFGKLGPIWQYWAQGPENAPDIVKLCLQSVERNRGGRDLIVLTDSTLRDHVELPEHVWAKRHLMTRTHFSNFVRLALLKTHGGTWFDATIMLRSPMPDALQRSSFYMLRADGTPRITETWFMHARSNHPLIVSWLDALADYWKSYDGLHGYFMFAYHIEASLYLHAPLRRKFLRMPQTSVREAHRLQWQFSQKFNPKRHRETFKASWLHKLSYKFERPDRPEMLLWDAILDGWPTAMPINARAFTAGMEEGSGESA